METEFVELSHSEMGIWSWTVQATTLERAMEQDAALHAKYGAANDRARERALREAALSRKAEQ